MMPWGPVIDGTDVGTKDLPLTRLRNGQGNYVPTIWGSNLNEGTIFVPLIALIVKGGSYPLNALSLNLTLLHFFDNNETMMESVLEHRFCVLVSFRAPCDVVREQWTSMVQKHGCIILNSQ